MAQKIKDNSSAGGGGDRRSNKSHMEGSSSHFHDVMYDVTGATRFLKIRSVLICDLRDFSVGLGYGCLECQGTATV